MDATRFQAITDAFQRLELAVVGDFCLDRYFDVDPEKNETSIETGLTVYNVVRVRCQPGGAGTILNNLSALGIGRIHALGFCGDDAEGFALRRALEQRRAVDLERFITSPERVTFTYSKPLLVTPGKPPAELNRLDIKNWEQTPSALKEKLESALQELASKVSGIILLDQVDLAGTGVVTDTLLNTLSKLATMAHGPFTLADSRRSLRGYPPVAFKMNRAELAAYVHRENIQTLPEIAAVVRTITTETRKPVFVTLAEEGICAASPAEGVWHCPALPLRGEIDIVGAGDSVSANLLAAITAGATLPEAMELAMVASSIVIHQLGTTGTASVEQIGELLPVAQPRAERLL